MLRNGAPIHIVRGAARPLDREVDARYLRRFHSARRGSGSRRGAGD